MPKLDEQTQFARREHILNAAEGCILRSGFHQTSMNDICRAAGISAGALYIYFASKEDLIAGLCERECQKLSENLAHVAEAPDFFAALTALAEHYTLEQPRHKLQLHIEIAAEAGRNPRVAEQVRAIDRFVLDKFAELLTRARDEGRIAPSLDIAVVTRLIAILGDGLFWHRALDSDFEPRTVLPAFMTLIATLINPLNGNAKTKLLEHASQENR